MLLPTLMLWVWAVADGAVGVWWDLDLPGRTGLLASWSLSLVVSSWVVADARKRGVRFCYDYDSLLFFAWPVVAPVYLFQTRRWKGILTALCFAGIFVSVHACAMLAVLLKGLLPGAKF